MKSILLLVILLNSITIFSQELIVENKKWNEMHHLIAACDCETYETHSYYINGDYTLNTQNYKILFEEVFDYTGESNGVGEIGYIREDVGAQQVYYRAKYGSNEYLLYDFSLELNDVFTLNSECKNENYTVTNVSNEEIEGVIRKTITLESEYEQIKWISGIGSETGFLNYENCFESQLLCVTEDDNKLFECEQKLGCIYLASVSVKENELVKFELFPNPVNNTLKISKLASSSLVKIMDVHGNCMEELSSDKETMEIDVSDYLSGVYIVKVGCVYGKFVKK